MSWPDFLEQVPEVSASVVAGGIIAKLIDWWRGKRGDDAAADASAAATAASRIVSDATVSEAWKTFADDLQTRLKHMDEHMAERDRQCEMRIAALSGLVLSLLKRRILDPEQKRLIAILASTDPSEDSEVGA